MYVFFMLETCRNIVSNGSIPPQPWSRPLIVYLIHRPSAPLPEAESSSERVVKKRPTLLSSLPILVEKESFLLRFFGGLVYAGFMIVMTSLLPQLKSTYNYNSLQIGLCYLPISFGPLLI